MEAGTRTIAAFAFAFGIFYEGTAAAASQRDPDRSTRYWEWAQENAPAEAIIRRIESRRGSMAVAKNGMVTSGNAAATKAGLDVLENGGNAMDAFIAAVAMEQVAGPGITSLAGTMGLLYYEARTGRTYYLDAGFDTPRKAGKFDFASDESTGKAVLGEPV